MKWLTALSILVIVISGPATADELEDALSLFLDAPGFKRQDTLALEAVLEPFWLQRESIAPGGDVGPIEKAVMIAGNAIASTRTRTMIDYGEMVVEEMQSPLPLSFITVRHFNLGPMIYDETVSAYGIENVARREEFGVGDSMEWRFVFRPIMGSSAVLVDASAKSLSLKEASKQQCWERLCLDMATGYDDIASWTDIEGALPDWPRQYPDMSYGVATPEHAVAELAVLGFWANAESGTYQWTGGERPEVASGFEPYRFIAIDRNLGQDAMIDTVWHETRLMDDSIAEIFYRRAEIAGWVSYMQASVPY